MSDVASNYRRIVERIDAAATRSGRDPQSVRLVAVTKSVSSDRIREAIQCGVTNIGENRLQESQLKREALSDFKISWHFIGHLQTNKAKKVVDGFDWVHSIDRADLAEKLNDYSTAKVLPILIEVKFDRSPTKSGVEVERLPLLINILKGYDRLNLCGLMTIPPLTDDPEAARQSFKALRELAGLFGIQELSMGMSNDFEIAIEEGATMIRVGTALFGSR